MLKMLKYEIKEGSRIILPCLIAIFILNLFMFNLGGKEPNGWLALCVVLGNIFALAAILFHLGNSFMKEFNQDRKFLTFTLPIGAKSLILAKLINTTIWLVLLALVQAVDMIILVIRTKDLNINNIFLEILDANIKAVIISIITLMAFGIIIYVYLMLSGYFVETLTKLLYKGKSRLVQGGMSAFLWIAQFMIFSKIAYKISSKVPIFLSVISGKIKFEGSSMGSSIVGMTEFGDYVMNHINITPLIIVLLISIGYFFGMAYLIDNKIDL
jgi:ABC-2 type transport system permease protein